MASIISPRPLSKQEYFMTIMGNTGRKHNSISKSELITELMKDPRFTLAGARMFIDKMYQSGVIYQPSSDQYRLVP